MCKKYAKIYQKLDTNTESERRLNFNKEEREEYTIRHAVDYEHFEFFKNYLKTNIMTIVNSSY